MGVGGRPLEEWPPEWGRRPRGGCENQLELAAGQVTAEAAACSKTLSCQQRFPIIAEGQSGRWVVVAEIGLERWQ